MKLILTEKPSVAKNIADALGIKQKKDGYFECNGYVITWAFGHLLELYDAKDYDAKMQRWRMDYFPFIPEHFQYKVKTNPKSKRQDGGAKKQLNIIRQLMKRQDVTMIISACDYDREGQLIGDSIIYHIKTNRPVYRLLLNEWTKEEVLKGLQQLKPNAQLRPLLDAGIGRQWADWVIGINLTSVATLKYQKGSGSALNIGRVLLPTLKIIYDRDQEIEHFKPEDYYKLSATFRTNEGNEYEGTYVVNKNEKFKDPAVLKKITQYLSNASATVIDITVESKKEYPPYLFNLSNLQGYITSKYKGWTSDKVLKVAQSLYEKKYITYPRTSSVVLDDSLVEKTKKVLEKIKKGLPYEQEIVFAKKKRVFDGSKVESHSAIIPTYVLPKSLATDEQVVYEAIKNRLIMQFMPEAEYEETKIITKVNHPSIEGVFVSKGKIQKVVGWKQVEKMESKDTYLPNIKVNDFVSVTHFQQTSHVTQPPKHHTEKTLLRVMETCGKSKDWEEHKADNQLMASILSGFSIGTPATRAETIKKLKDVGYITTQNKYLVCTELGKKLVETFPVKELFNLDFTGRLEKALSDIEKQRVSKEQFLHFIFDFTKKAVDRVKKDQEITLNEVQKKRFEVVGACPVCGKPVIEGQKGFGCSGFKQGCTFVIWKNDSFLASLKKKPTKTMVKTLLKNGKVEVKGLTSKKGNKFDAILSYEKNPDSEYFSWKMAFPNPKPSR